MAEVLHPLQQGLDRLRAEILSSVRAGPHERICLVDEEDAVEGSPNRAVGLDRRRADVFADQAGPIDLDQVPLLEQPHRAVHLSEEPRDRRLPGTGIAAEDEVLRSSNLGQPVLETPRLHLQEGDQRSHLLLDGLEADQRIELRLQLLQWKRRQRLAQLVGDPIDRIAARRLAEPIAYYLQAARDIVKRVRAHFGSSMPPSPWPAGFGFVVYINNDKHGETVERGSKIRGQTAFAG